MAQAEFLQSLLKAAKDAGIHTCIETCGCAPEEAYQNVIPFVDLILFDYKVTDSKKSKEMISVPSNVVLDRLDFLCQHHGNLHLRCPLIPGVNDDTEDIEALHRFVRNRIQEIHFLPYHAISAAKWKRLGMENRLNGVKPVLIREVRNIKEKFTELGYTVCIGG